MPLNSILLKSDIINKQNLDYINQIWFAIMGMDIIDLYVLLDDRVNYGDLTKQQFIEKLDIKFKKHTQICDEEFYLNLIECHKDHKGEIICEFVGIESGINLGVYFEIEDDQLVGLYFCECFGGVEDLDNYGV